MINKYGLVLWLYHRVDLTVTHRGQLDAARAVASIIHDY